MPFIYEPRVSKINEDDARVMKTSNALTNASHALRQILECISPLAAECKKHADIIRLRRDFSSLPDEILSDVLEYSAYTPDIFGNEQGGAFRTVMEAIRLSHTCQRFRQLVMRIPSLWNRISNTMPTRMISACCDRLTIANADVVMRLPFSQPQPNPQFIFTTANHWLRRVHIDVGYLGNNFPIADFQEIAKVVKNLNASSLLELEIHHPTFALDQIEVERNQDAVHFYSTWSMPRLSSLITKNTIPLPFATPVSLRSLKIYMNYESIDLGEGRINAQALVTFLASCTVLEEVALRLAYASDISRLVLPVEKLVNLDRVTAVQFDFVYCNSNVIKSILDIVHFPFASSVNLYIRSGYELDSPDEWIDNVLLSILPDASAFPKLTNLQLDLQSGPRTISLPFPSLIKVKRLLLTTDFALAPIPDGKCLPALRTLVLAGCSKLESDWIAIFLRRLKEQGTFEPQQLVVEGCAWTKSPGGSVLDEPGDKEVEYVEVTADEMLQLIM